MSKRREEPPKILGQWGQRKSGLFVPFGALPQSKKNEVGDFCATYDDVDEMLEFMQGAGFSIFQDLPMSPLDDFNSPYSPVTSFAVNPFRIDLGRVAKDGDLRLGDIKLYEKELELISDQKSHEAINKRKELKTKLLKVAYKNFSNDAVGVRKAEFDEWKKEQSHWLDAYATYEILKEMPGNRGRVWQE